MRSARSSRDSSSSDSARSLPLTSPQSTHSTPTPLSARPKSRAVSGTQSQTQNSANSPISSYEASRLYLKSASARSSSYNDNNLALDYGSDVISTPKSRSLYSSVHNSGSSITTLTAPDMSYKPIPSPFDSKSPLSSPVQKKNVRKYSSGQPSSNHSSWQSSQIPSQLSQLSQQLQQSNLQAQQQPVPIQVSAPDFSPSRPGSNYAMANPYMPQRIAKPPLPPKPRKLCIFCFDSNNAIGVHEDLSCGCVAHEECLRSRLKLEKERAMSNGTQSPPMLQFPQCDNCGVKAIPRNVELKDELVSELMSYKPKPLLLNTSPQLDGSKLYLDTNVYSTSPQHSHNPYQNVNSPSSAFNPYTRTVSPRNDLSVFASNPYIQNTLKREKAHSPTEPESQKTSKVTQKVNKSPQLGESLLVRKISIPNVAQNSHPRFQSRRRAPSPPNRLPYDSGLRKEVSKNRANLVIDIPQKGQSLTNEQKKDVHLSSYEILNSGVPKSGGDSFGNDKFYSRSLRSSDSSEDDAELSAVSSEEQSPSPDANHITASISRSNSLSSSYSVSTSNTHSGVEDLESLQEKYVTRLLDISDQGGFTESINQSTVVQFGELRLVDLLEISINSKTSKYQEMVVYLFRSRILMLAKNNAHFVSLRLEPKRKIPKVEIQSNYLIKLDFSSRNNKNVSSVYISVDESKSEVIQKWAAALSDYDCSFPAQVFTGTLNSTFLEDSPDLSDHQDTHNSGLMSPLSPVSPQPAKHISDVRSSVSTFVPKHGSTLFSHTSESQTTLSMRQSTNGNSRLRSTLILTAPDSFFIILNDDSKMTSAQKPLLVSILKVIQFKVKNLALVITKRNFSNVPDAAEFEHDDYFQDIKHLCINSELCHIAKSAASDESTVSKLIQGFIQSNDAYREVKNTGVLYLSTTKLEVVPQCDLAAAVGFMEAGITTSGISTQMLPNNVISVPIWDNLLEAICTKFHISFDQSSDSSSDELDYSESESESEESDSD